MLETDISVCLLTYSRVNGDLQVQRLSKISQKCQFWPLNLEYSIWYLNVLLRHFQWLSMVRKLICQHVFWTALGYMVISRVKNLSRKCQKCQFWTINLNHPIWCRTLYREIFNDYLWSHMIEIDMPAWWWSSGSQIGQKKLPKISILVLESKLSNLVP